jgi:hypothetical protein
MCCGRDAWRHYVDDVELQKTTDKVVLLCCNIYCCVGESDGDFFFVLFFSLIFFSFFINIQCEWVRASADLGQFSLKEFIGNTIKFIRSNKNQFDDIDKEEDYDDDEDEDEDENEEWEDLEGEDVCCVDVD